MVTLLTLMVNGCNKITDEEESESSWNIVIYLMYNQFDRDKRENFF